MQCCGLGDRPVSLGDPRENTFHTHAPASLLVELRDGISLVEVIMECHHAVNDKNDTRTKVVVNFRSMRQSSSRTSSSWPEIEVSNEEYFRTRDLDSQPASEFNMVLIFIL